MQALEICSPEELSDDAIARWLAILAEEPELDRPFFHPSYFRVLQEVGRPVEIAQFRDSQGRFGFFPFERYGRSARPVGARLSDFQGFIARSDYEGEIANALPSCGLSVWHYDHRLVRPEGPEGPDVGAMAESPYADLSVGFDAFFEAHRRSGAGWTKQIPRKARKLTREVGELRFEYATDDPSVLTTLREWKKAQRERTGTIDPLDESWASEAVERFLSLEQDDFRGVLSALYSGDVLIAAHLGLRTESTLHVWFPAYDPKWERYSPGMLFFVELLRAASRQGIRRVDFGKGDARYKRSLRSGSSWVSEGCVDRRFLGRFVSRLRYGLRERFRGGRLAEASRGPRRRIRRLVHGWRRPSN